MKNKFFKHFKSFYLPALAFGALTGILTGAVIVLFKLCAMHVIEWSESIYSYIGAHLYLCLAAAAVLLLIAYLTSLLYKRCPNAKGGGIPTSIAILRGILTFGWLKNLLSVYFSSLITFFVGVPLGNEGPSVQIGTALGKGLTKFAAPNRPAWGRYVMTGGACAGFAAATNAPISGILFAVEEAHQRVSPLIITMSIVAVVFSTLTSVLLSPVVRVESRLFTLLEVPALPVSAIWLPIVTGIALGLFSVFVLKLFKYVNRFYTKILRRIPSFIKIFIVFALTFIFGLISYSFVSTGHDLVNELLKNGGLWYMLVFILLFRTLMMLLASSTGITGGLFLPIIAVGAVLSSLIANALIACGLISSEYYSAIILLGITACIAGMMKTPLTAIVFAIEALCLINNVLFAILSAMLSYLITELFKVSSINDSVIKMKSDERNAGKTSSVIDAFVTVADKAFVTGKQIRDILWPNNLFVLSIQHSEQNAVMDEHGGKTIRSGDVLHVRYSTLDDAQTKAELCALVGNQPSAEKTVTHV